MGTYYSSVKVYATDTLLSPDCVNSLKHDHIVNQVSDHLCAGGDFATSFHHQIADKLLTCQSIPVSAGVLQLA